MQCREKLLCPKERHGAAVAAEPRVAGGCAEDVHNRAVPQRQNREEAEQHLALITQNALHLNDTSLYSSMSTCGRGVQPWLSPRNAVAGVGVTVPRAVTRTAAVLVKPPVSQHAAVTAGASDTRLTSALPAGGVTQRAAS